MKVKNVYKCTFEVGTGNLKNGGKKEILWVDVFYKEGIFHLEKLEYSM